MSQIVAAACAYRADIVALSFSVHIDPRAVRAGVRQLRHRLPASTELWCGGHGALRLKRLPERVTAFRSMEQLSQELARWRDRARSD